MFSAIFPMKYLNTFWGESISHAELLDLFFLLVSIALISSLFFRHWSRPHKGLFVPDGGPVLQEEEGGRGDTGGGGQWARDIGHVGLHSRGHQVSQKKRTWSLACMTNLNLLVHLH